MIRRRRRASPARGLAGPLIIIYCGALLGPAVLAATAEGTPAAEGTATAGGTDIGKGTAVAEEAPAGGAPAAPPPRKSFSDAFRTFAADGRYLLTFPSRTTPRGVWTTIGCLAGTGYLVHCDDQIRAEVREDRANGSGRVYKRFSALGTETVEAVGLGSFYLLARASKSTHAVRTASTAFEAYLWTLPLTSVGKKIFARERPTGDADARGFFSGGSIFPSGHTARSFAIAAVLADAYGRKAALFAYPMAALIGTSTIERDVHWASDVAAGAGLGLAIGKAISRRHADRADPRAAAGPGAGPRAARVDWALVPGPGGAALSLRY